MFEPPALALGAPPTFELPALALGAPPTFGFPPLALGAPLALEFPALLPPLPGAPALVPSLGVEDPQPIAEHKAEAIAILRQ